MDVSRAYTGATTAAIPHAVICYDGFHIMRWIHRALDRVFADAAVDPPSRDQLSACARSARRCAPGDQTHRRQTRTGQPDHPSQPSHRTAWHSKNHSETCIALITNPASPADCSAWIYAAKRSRIPAFVSLGKRFHAHFEPILAAIELGISNALIEASTPRSASSTPALRPPLRPNTDLNDLPLPRDYSHTTHTCHVFDAGLRSFE